MHFGKSLINIVAVLIGGLFIRYRVFNSNLQEAYDVFAVILLMFTMGNAATIFARATSHYLLIMEGVESAGILSKTIENTEDNEPEIEMSQEDKATPLRGRVQLENVSFTYSSVEEAEGGRRRALSGVSVEFAEGEVSSICGESGSGKSTVLQLMEKFYSPGEGRVLIDGRDLAEMENEWLRRQIGYVAQQPVLFDCSIRENIVMGVEGVPEEEIIRVLFQNNA